MKEIFLEESQSPISGRVFLSIPTAARPPTVAMSQSPISGRVFLSTARQIDRDIGAICHKALLAGECF